MLINQLQRKQPMWYETETCLATDSCRESNGVSRIEYFAGSMGSTKYSKKAWMASSVGHSSEASMISRYSNFCKKRKETLNRHSHTHFPRWNNDAVYNY